MSRYFYGPLLIGAIGFLFGWHVGEGMLGLDRVVALMPAALFGLFFFTLCLVCEYRRKPDTRDQQEVYVSNERYDE